MVKLRIILAAMAVIGFGSMAYLVFGAGVTVRDAENGKVLLAYDRFGRRLVVNGYVLESGGPGMFDVKRRAPMGGRQAGVEGGRARGPLHVQHMEMCRGRLDTRGLPVVALRLHGDFGDEFGDSSRLIESDVRFILHDVNASQGMMPYGGCDTMRDERVMWIAAVAR